jgi:hypothetical protein
MLSLFPRIRVHCYTHYCPQSSLVVSWQRIHKSVTVTEAHSEVFFAQPNPFLAIILPTANSGNQLNFNCSSVSASLYSLGTATTEITASFIVACPYFLDFGTSWR